MFLFAVFDELGAVFEVWTVSLLLPLPLPFSIGFFRFFERPVWQLDLAIGLFGAKYFAVGGGEEGGFVIW